MNGISRLPVVRVDHVGSLIRPAALMLGMQNVEAGKVDPGKIEPLQDEAIRDVVKLQESLGLAVVTDGEFRRRSWQRGFIDALGCISIRPGILSFRDGRGTVNPQPAAYVEAPLRRRRPIAVKEFSFLASATSRLAKLTLPSPSIFHLGLFSNCVDRKAYPDLDTMLDDLVQIYRDEIADLAAAGCRYLQLDEVALITVSDPENQQILRRHGEDPEAIIDLYFRLIGSILDRRPSGMTVVMHLCRGNQAGLWSAAGGYEPIAERLFNELPIDGYLLEYDTPRAGDFAPLRHLPADKIALLGLISTKDPVVEPAELLQARLDEACRFVPLNRLGLCTQCGFSSSISSWNKTQNPMTEAVEVAKLRRLVGAGGAFWRDGGLLGTLPERHDA